MPLIGDVQGIEAQELASAAYGIAHTNTHNASAALTADMVGAPSAGQPFPGGASQASLSGHADSIAASVSHYRPAAVLHPVLAPVSNITSDGLPGPYVP